MRNTQRLVRMMAMADKSEQEKRYKEREEELRRREEKLRERENRQPNAMYYGDTYDDPKMLRYLPPIYPEMRSEDWHGNGGSVKDTWIPPTRPMIGYDRDMPRMTYGGDGRNTRKIFARGDIMMDQPWDNDSEYGDQRKHKVMPMNEMSARAWVKKMKNSDGTHGEHFTKEITDQVRQAHAPGCDEWEFYATMNMMYSDYSSVAKQMGFDKTDFYAMMAKAFLDDEDAGDMKLEKYHAYIVEK